MQGVDLAPVQDEIVEQLYQLMKEAEAPLELLTRFGFY